MNNKVVTCACGQIKKEGTKCSCGNPCVKAKEENSTDLKPMCLIQARDLCDAWHLVLIACTQFKFSQIYKIDRGSYAGQKRLEIDTMCLDIFDPGSGPLVPQMPQGKEHLAPTTQEQAEQYLTYLMTAEKQETEEYTYGERLVEQKIYYDCNAAGWADPWETGPDQIDEVIKMYKEQGHNTNQATMEIGTPSDILLDDPPCLRLVDTRIRNNKLHFIIYFRSWDAYNGLPVNLAGLEQLKQYMASEIGVKNGSIRAFSKGVHVYEEVWPFMCERLNINFDSWKLGK